MIAEASSDRCHADEQNLRALDHETVDPRTSAGGWRVPHLSALRPLVCSATGRDEERPDCRSIAGLPLPHVRQRNDVRPRPARPLRVGQAFEPDTGVSCNSQQPCVSASSRFSFNPMNSHSNAKPGLRQVGKPDLLPILLFFLCLEDALGQGLRGGLDARLSILADVIDHVAGHRRDLASLAGNIEAAATIARARY